jgi:hypothetical protein
LGDVVKVEIIRANLEKKQLDFRLIKENSENKNTPKYSSAPVKRRRK